MTKPNATVFIRNSIRKTDVSIVSIELSQNSCAPPRPSAPQPLQPRVWGTFKPANSDARPRPATDRHRETSS
jgi:hypothetical protein